MRPRLIAVDVNGMKGPNKWGRDVHFFRLEMAYKTSIPQYVLYNFIEKGARTVNELLYGED